MSRLTSVSLYTHTDTVVSQHSHSPISTNGQADRCEAIQAQVLTCSSQFSLSKLRFPLNTASLFPVRDKGRKKNSFYKHTEKTGDFQEK